MCPKIYSKYQKEKNAEYHHTGDICVFCYGGEEKSTTRRDYADYSEQTELFRYATIQVGELEKFQLADLSKYDTVVLGTPV